MASDADSGGSAPGDIASPEGGPSRVLVVDDSLEQIRFLERVLSKEGYECHSVSDGRDAARACAAVRPDLVLLDVEMPGSDGIEICRALKSNPETRLVPVLIMTGRADRSHHLQALEAGADDFLPKPIGLAELRARVRSATRMKRYIDELDNAAASIMLLGAAIEARDRTTAGHCQRLADSASRLGRAIGLDADDVRALERGGYLHDLGKIAIPDAVLFKPGPLTGAEYELIKSHTRIGDNLCRPLRTLHRVRPIIRSHHETLDGKGYPDGLSGSRVPLLAQITAIADVYDALTSDRPYRPALSRDHACEMLYREVSEGKRDRALVDRFVGMLDSTSDVERVGATD